MASVEDCSYRILRHTVLLAHSLNIFWCNDAYLKLTGFSYEEVIGKTPVEVFLCEFSNKEEINKMLEAFYKGEIFDVDIYHAHKTKKPFWILVTLTNNL